MPAFYHKMSELIIKHLNGTLSEEEKIALEQEINSSALKKRLFTELTDLDNLSARINRREQIDLDAHWDKLQQQLARHHKIKRLKYIGLAAAAILVVSLGAWRLLLAPKQAVLPLSDNKQSQPIPVKPDSNECYLVKSDGTKILLDQLADGETLSDGQAIIRKVNDGLEYRAKSDNDTIIAHNQRCVPNKRKDQVMLSDGSHIWLNAASSMRFPTAFTGPERVIEIRGEAYFEVNGNVKKPFKAIICSDSTQSGTGVRGEVEVLGTHFNIKAYDDDVIQTTLTKGKLKVSAGNPYVILKPGEQAIINKKRVLSKKAITTAENTIAWKDGEFLFEEEDIPGILQEIGRWYDVKIVYTGAIPNRKPIIHASHTDSLEKVLDMIRHYDVEIKVIDKTQVMLVGTGARK